MRMPKTRRMALRTSSTEKPQYRRSCIMAALFVAARGITSTEAIVAPIYNLTTRSLGPFQIINLPTPVSESSTTVIVAAVPAVHLPPRPALRPSAAC
jgi:hypothetical protein